VDSAIEGRILGALEPASGDNRAVSSLLAAGSTLVPTLAATSDAHTGPAAALMGLGLLIALYGHGAKSKWAIATGIILIAAAALLLQFTFKTSSHGQPPLNGPGGGSG
jgi:hypothetical protein